MVITFFNDQVGQIDIPQGLKSLRAFRRWAEKDYPEDGRVWFIKGQVLVDMSKEQIFTHVQVKTKYYVVLGGLADAERLGLFLADGAFFANVEADIAGNPDGIFIANHTLEEGRVKLVEGARSGFTEIEGSPDMVLEVVSDSSVRKDLVLLKEPYWEAGVREYWLVDARKEPLRFDIYRHTGRGFVAVRKQAGWLKSEVFGRSFRLVETLGPAGHPGWKAAERPVLRVLENPGFSASAIKHNGHYRTLPYDPARGQREPPTSDNQSYV